MTWVSKPIPLINLGMMACGDKNITNNAVAGVIERINRGNLYIEYGNPHISSLSGEEAKLRIMTISKERVCGCFKDFFIERVNDSLWLSSSISLAGPFGNDSESKELIISALSKEDPRNHLKYRGFCGNDEKTLIMLVTWDFYP